MQQVFRHNDYYFSSVTRYKLVKIEHLRRSPNGHGTYIWHGGFPIGWLYSCDCLQRGGWLAARYVNLSSRMPFWSADTSDRLNEWYVLEYNPTFSVSLVSKTRPNYLSIDRDYYPLAFRPPPRPVARPAWPPALPPRSPRLPLPPRRPPRKFSSPI